MDVVSNNYMPGDPRLVEQLVYELKSQGIFDQFRKECIADVDTKPAYQNLRQRVEGSVTSFLSQQTWRPDMNKNQLREQLRKNIYESGFLETGVERIVDQVVNPKINTTFLPQVEDVVYRYLGIEKPNRCEIKKELKIDVTDLLPTDLEAISPESDHTKDESLNFNDSLNSESKMDEDESPPFEPIEANSSSIQHEENSVDSHLSGISGLQSHDSNPCTDSKLYQTELSNQDSQVSQNSSESRLSIITSEDNTKMEIREDSNSKPVKTIDSSSQIEITPPETQVTFESNSVKKEETTIKSVDEAETHIDSNMVEEKNLKKREDENIDKSKQTDEKQNDDRKHERKSDDKKSRSSSSKDRRDDKYKKPSSSSSSSRDKEKSSSKHGSSSKDKLKDKKESRSSSANSKDREKEKDSQRGDREKDKMKSDRDRTEKDRDRKEKDKHEKDKSSKEKEKSTKDKGKSSSSSNSNSSKYNSKERDKSSNKSDSDKKDKDKQRISSSSSSKDGKSKLSSYSDSKSKSSSSDKHKRDDRSSNSRHSGGSSSSSKRDKDKKKDSKKEVKDDHYSSKDKKNDRRSTDRDSNDGRSGKSSQVNSSPEVILSQAQKSSQESSNSTSGSGSGDSGTSDQIELQAKNPESAADASATKNAVMQGKLKYVKPKFASNFEEARKLMKIRKQLAKMERQNQLGLTQINVPTEMSLVNGVSCTDKDTAGTAEVNGTETPSPEKAPIIQSRELSQENWEALEARLAQEMSNVNYNSYESPYDEYDYATISSITTSPRKTISNVRSKQTVKEETVTVEKTQGETGKSGKTIELCRKTEQNTEMNSVDVYFTKDAEAPNGNNSPEKPENSAAEHKGNTEEQNIDSRKSDKTDTKTDDDSKMDIDVTEQLDNTNSSCSDTEPCAYLEPFSPRLDRNLQYLKMYIDKLEQEVKHSLKTFHNNFTPTKQNYKRKLTATVDVRNNNKVHYEPTTDARKRKRSVAPNPNSVTSKANKEKLCNVSDISPNDSFSLPLSPAESDKSIGKKDDESVKVKQRRVTFGRGANTRNQRYSSEDLYKPRLVFPSSRRSRGAKNEEK